jgi:hypothetical protein
MCLQLHSNTRWCLSSEKFDVRLADRGDLVSVVLWEGGPNDIHIGHVAVPLSRIQQAGKEVRV